MYSNGYENNFHFTDHTVLMTLLVVVVVVVVVRQINVIVTCRASDQTFIIKSNFSAYCFI